MTCPLCESPLTTSFETQRRPRDRFWICGVCSLVSRDPAGRLTHAAEKARYDQHDNGGEGHRRFLLPVVDAVTALCEPRARGLDWGSGPVPVLARMLDERGFAMEKFDPFFGPMEKPNGVFDFITLTEVIEHMHSPGRELASLRARLKPGGCLFVQTDASPGGEIAAYFENWGYRNDPTHVSFFTMATFEFLKNFGWDIVSPGRRLTILRRA